MSALWLGSFLVGSRPPIISAASRITYEFFLTHGPIYLALATLAKLDLVANAVIGTAGSVLAAVLLHRASRGVSSALRRFGRRAIAHSGRRVRYPARVPTPQVIVSRGEVAEGTGERSWRLPTFAM